MTTTDKPVSRVTRDAYRVLYVSPRRIVVRIGPGDVLSFRERGRRHWFSLPIAAAFRVAVGHKWLPSRPENARAAG